MTKQLTMRNGDVIDFEACPECGLELHPAWTHCPECDCPLP